MKNIILILVLIGIVQPLFSQIYKEKQTRHRFAQLSIGFDIQAASGGSTKYINAGGNIASLDYQTSVSPRFLIGGTHFWGHADFYIAIPLYNQTINQNNQDILSIRGVETVFKYYPWRIEYGKIRPYLGTSLAPFYYEQSNNNFEYPSGPELNYYGFPLLGGVSYNSNQHLLELGLAWNYNNKIDYHISPNQLESVETAQLYATLSYKYILETTLSAESDWESGRTKEVTDRLADQNKLNGFYLGVGISSAFWLKESSYNTNNRPYIYKYNTAIMPDFTLGYYMHKPDVNLAFGYRGYSVSTDSYATDQLLQRKSILFEATKYLFDYHGFVPFIGPAVSYEKLSFNEIHEGNDVIDISENKFAFGLSFGWDIRPNRIQSWLLRTNLRWYPNLYLSVEPDSKVSFDNLEFNFIQLIIYPDRMF